MLVLFALSSSEVSGESAQNASLLAYTKYGYRLRPTLNFNRIRIRQNGRYAISTKISCSGSKVS